MKLSLALFTKNEELALVKLLTEIENLNIDFKEKIIVDDSHDKTPDIAAAFGFTVIRGQNSLGGAFVKMLEFFKAHPVDYVVTMDGDGQADPREIQRFIDTAITQKADLVLGSRFLDTHLINYKYPHTNRWGVFLLSLYLRLETGFKITDSHGGLRCYSQKFIESCKLLGRHTYVQESILHARDFHLNVHEIPSAWLTRRHGSSRVVRSKLEYILKVLPYLLLRSRRIVPTLFAIALCLLSLQIFR